MKIEQIVSELKSERDRLEQAISTLHRLSGRTETTWSKTGSKVVPITPRNRRLTPAARRRISEAQKRRWARQRKAA